MIFTAIYQSLKNSFRLTEQIRRYFHRLLLRCTPTVQRESRLAAEKTTQLIDFKDLRGDDSLPSRSALAAAC
jgi:hypothetical protein